MPATFPPPDSSLHGANFNAGQTFEWMNEHLNKWVAEIEAQDTGTLNHTVSGVLYGQEFSVLTQSPRLRDSM